MDKNLVLGILTFAVAVLQLLSQQTFVPQAVVPYLLFAVGVVNLAMSTFFAAQVRSVSAKIQSLKK